MDEPAQIIIKEDGNVKIEGDFNRINLIGLLQAELSRQKILLEENQRMEIKKEHKQEQE